MPKRRSHISDLEREAQAGFYLVEITWDDGIRTIFAIQARDAYQAQRLTEEKAFSMWEGSIVQVEVHAIPIPAAINDPEHVYTDDSGYKETSP